MEKKDGERGAELSATEKASAWGSMVYGGDLEYPDIKKVGCMRDSFLYGIGSGLPLGTLAFLHTKEVIVGCRAAVGACIAVGLGSWEYCKYQRRQQMQMVKDTVDAMNRPTGGAAPIANAKPQAQGVAVKPGQACHDEK
eukprot:gene2625-24257_t